VAQPTIPVTIGQILKLRIFCLCGQQLSVNVLYYRFAAVEIGGVGDLQELAAQLAPRFASNYKPMISTATEYRGVGLQNMKTGQDDEIPSMEVFNATNAGYGTGGTPTLPKQTCGVIAKRTTVLKRNGRGRTYIPFPAAAHNELSGSPNAAYLALLNTMAISLFTTFSVSTPGENLNTLEPVLKSDITPKTDPPPPFTTFQYLPIVDYTARIRWGTQRRRSDFGKLNTTPV